MQHLCHAKKCEVEVPPELLMCLHHWKMVPKNIQQDVYQHYRVGQCSDKRPSKEWMKAARSAINYVYSLEYEDARKTGLKNGLRQLTVMELQRVLNYPHEMVLDEFNYQDGKFCPLAVALELDKTITNPSHDIIFETLNSMGYKVYNTRGLKGHYYTTNRKEDLIEATEEVIEEKKLLESK